MFDFDSFREIWGTIRKNKMRTFLTGFAVAWGIFMLIVLLASSNGLRNGVMSNFSGRAINSVFIAPGWTSMPHNGMPSDRRIRFDQRDYNLICELFPEMEYISVNITQNVTLSYGTEYGSWRLLGVSSEMPRIKQIAIGQGKGRFLSRLDMDERKKVIVISPEIAKVLFKGEDPLGKYVTAENIAYRVVGIYDDENQYGTSLPAYIPWTTAQALYRKGYGLNWIDFTVRGLDTPEANRVFVERLRRKMGELHNFDPRDRSALYVSNTAEDALQARQIFTVISLFTLIVGVASLMAGIVGVGNIMLITVKERTREIGIRKAIGASPGSILELIILEAILITTCAGYIGIVLGVGLTELVSAFMFRDGGQGNRVFMDPTVDLGTVLWATLFLIVCGVLAGLVPALKATRVRPIEAMRAE